MTFNENLLEVISAYSIMQIVGWLLESDLASSFGNFRTRLILLSLQDAPSLSISNQAAPTRPNIISTTRAN